MIEARDGFAALTGGQNSGLDPLLVPDSAYCRGINVVVRGGFLKTRPGMPAVCDLGTGTFQGARRWSLKSGDYLVYVLSGHVFVADPVTKTVQDMGLLFETEGLCYFIQAYKWMVIQNGISRPVVLQEDDGVFSRVTRDVVTDAPAETPSICLVKGTVGEYTHGRIHYVPTIIPAMAPDPDDEPDAIPEDTTEPGIAAFVSSDIIDLEEPETVFRMSEHRVLNEGGAAALPSELGHITAMGVLRGAATGTGMGALIVFGREGVSGFEVSSSRAQWGSVGFSQVLFTGAGTVSPWAVLNINDDLWYTGTDGHLRSLRYDKNRLAGGALYNTPMSFEMQHFVSLTDKAWLPYTSAALADNRMLWTLCDGDALGVLDFARVYDLSQASAPSYDGVWTGFHFDFVAALNGNVYVIVSFDGKRTLRMLSPTAIEDVDGAPIEAQLITRRMGFYVGGNSALASLKRLQYVEMALDEVSRDTTVEVYFRPEHYVSWVRMGSHTVYVPKGTASQYRRRVRIAVDHSNVGCNPVSEESLATGQSFQFLIKITGHAKVVRFVPVAEVLSEAPPDNCVDNADRVAYSSDDGQFDFSYEVYS